MSCTRVAAIVLLILPPFCFHRTVVSPARRPNAAMRTLCVDGFVGVAKNMRKAWNENRANNSEMLCPRPAQANVLWSGQGEKKLCVGFGHGEKEGARVLVIVENWFSSFGHGEKPVFECLSWPFWVCQTMDKTRLVSAPRVSHVYSLKGKT